MTTTEECRNCSEESCSAQAKRPGEGEADYLDRQQLARRMCRIKHKIIVLSGKGGVGKSTVAVNAAVSLSTRGHRVGLLDIDIHGPSVPRLLGLEGRHIAGNGTALLPVDFSENLKVMSMGFMLRERSDAVIWRGPMKYTAIKQFLRDVDWGDLDYLVIDSPPGTGDEPLSICQFIENAQGAVVVTTPQELALLDVRKSINFCRQLGVPILGVVENMSGFVCPNCGEVTHIFKSGGAEHMAREMGVPFLGRIPIDSGLVASCDAGAAFDYFNSDTGSAGSFATIIEAIVGADVEKEEGKREDAGQETVERRNGEMRVAIPVAGGKLSPHFGHCEEFAIIDVDPQNRSIAGSERVPAPEHQPGLLPRWLAERGATMIIAGGMGMRAQNLFAEHGIVVVVGAPAADPESIVKEYLAGTLKTGDNICDH